MHKPKQQRLKQILKPFEEDILAWFRSRFFFWKSQEPAGSLRDLHEVRELLIALEKEMNHS